MTDQTFINILTEIKKQKLIDDKTIDKVKLIALSEIEKERKKKKVRTLKKDHGLL